MFGSGLGLTNAQWREYTQIEISAVLDLNPSGLLFIAYLGDSTQPTRIQQEANLCRDLSIPSPIVRVYLPEVMRSSPQDVSFECYVLIQQYKAVGLDPQLIPANELNHPGERGVPTEVGWQEDWEVQAEWLAAFARDFSMRSPNTCLHLPALSPNGNYRDGWTEYHRAGLHALFNMVDVHCYAWEQLADALATREYFQKPACITEWNQISAREVIGVVELGVPSYYFILDSSDPSFWWYSLLRNQTLYEDFKTAQNTSGGGTQPMTQEELWKKLTTPYESYPALTKAIVAMGGIPIGTEVVVDEYTFQLGLVPTGGQADDVVAYARTGDWESVVVAHDWSTLPLV